MPRKFIAICSLFLVIFALAACAPAALTSKTVEGNVTGSYFDSAVMHNKPEGIRYSESALEKGIVRRNDNYTRVLEQKIKEIGGDCRVKSDYYYCTISRYRKSDECFNGRCGIAIKRWTTHITWHNHEGSIEPHVKIHMTIDPI